MKCKCCGREFETNEYYKVNGSRVIGIYECPHCQAVQGECYAGESYGIVKPQWHQGDSQPEDERYYDIVAIGSKIERRHGWFNTKSRMITQVG